VGIDLANCLAVADATLHAIVAQAGTASAACPLTRLAIAPAPRGKQSIGRISTGAASGLSVSCSRSAGSLTMHLATTGGVPLSKFVGPHLQVGVVRSERGAGPATISFTFHTAQNSATAPPDVTGAWVNKATPTAGPPWQLTTSNHGQTLDATWTGGAGHTGLHGSFHGSLTKHNGADAYTGTFHITEASTNVDGTATFTIDNPKQIQIDIQPNGGTPTHYTFIRTG
jgi:hypothetical protein